MKSFLIGLITSLLLTGGLMAQQAPKALTNPDPVYPPEAAELGYGGTVNVVIRVDKKGKVKVLQSVGPNAPCSNLNDRRVKKIREVVVDTARMLEFEPPLQNGKPTEIEMTVSYSFDSTGKPAKPKDLSESKGRIVEAGVLMGRVKHLARPDYPASARANRLAGPVSVSVCVDVDGKVIAASALGGDRGLQDSAVDAACRSSIEPVQLSGVPVQVSGVITFVFVP